MKKLALCLLLAYYGAQPAIAQKFYIKAGVGYAMPMLGQKVDRYGNYYNGLTVVHGGAAGYNLKNASFSSGALGIVGAGYMFADNIGIELAANVNITSDPQLIYGTSGYNNVYVSATTKKAGHTLMLIPSLIMQTAYTTVNVYTRLGLALPFNTKITQVDSVYSYVYSASSQDRYSWRSKHYFSVGFSASGGLKVRLKKHLSVWTEASMMYLSLSPKEKALDYAVVDGKKLEPSGVNTIQTKFEYSRSGISSEFPQPFSNMSATVGINYQLKVARKSQKAAPANKDK